jgi:hypothetical protein
MWQARERTENCIRSRWRSPKERDHSESRGTDGKMGLEWILGGLVGGCGGETPVSGWGMVAGCCECGDEPSGSGATELVNNQLL